MILFQAGLSWATVLRKRAAYRRVFCGFDPKRVADFGNKEVDNLMKPESGIVKNKAKILSTINNAK